MVVRYREDFTVRAPQSRRVVRRREGAKVSKKWKKIVPLGTFPMKIAAAESPQFLTNSEGERVGVLLHLKTYERLRETEEDLADVKAYDARRKKALREIRSRQASTLRE
jgi:hypothetical protein